MPDCHVDETQGPVLSPAFLGLGVILVVEGRVLFPHPWGP